MKCLTIKEAIKELETYKDKEDLICMDIWEQGDFENEIDNENINVKPKELMEDFASSYDCSGNGLHGFELLYHIINEYNNK